MISERERVATELQTDLYRVGEEHAMLFPHRAVVHCALWSVSDSFRWNIQSLTKYPKINNTGIGGNNMAKSIDYQILA